MEIRNYIKSLLALNCVTIKRLAEMLSEKTGREYSAKSLSHKLRRESLSLKEAYEIADLIGYKIEFIKKDLH